MLTGAEAPTAVGRDDVPPTVPAQVTADTPLEALHLNWRERDLPEHERTKHVHRLHPYLGKFIPQLVEVFLRKYFQPGMTVLDPFCGSGTTLVQANELGVHAVGYDISAFNVLLCRAKTARYDLGLLHREVHDALEKTRQPRGAGSGQLGLWGEITAGVAPAEADGYLKTWYAPQALDDLLRYRDLIEGGGYQYRDLLRVILSRSARSARMTAHYDLDFPKAPQREPYHCHKHFRTCRPTTEALKFLVRYSGDALRRVEEFAAVRSGARVEVHHADSRQAEVPRADGVITSPPYVGLIDYHEQHAYAYHLLGLEDRRGQEIGPATGGAGKRAREQYQEDMAEVFGRICRSLAPGAPLVVVAHDRAGLYPRIAEMAGVETDGLLRRHVNRRTGRRSGDFHESVFIWRTPRG